MVHYLKNFVHSQPENEHRAPSVHLPSILFVDAVVCVQLSFFPSAGRVLPTFSAASGGALGCFSDQQTLHCSQPEHSGRIPTDVLYSI